VALINDIIHHVGSVWKCPEQVVVSMPKNYAEISTVCFAFLFFQKVFVQFLNFASLFCFNSQIILFRSLEIIINFFFQFLKDFDKTSKLGDKERHQSCGDNFSDSTRFDS